MPITRALCILGPRYAGQTSALAACHHYGWQTLGHLPVEDVASLLAAQGGQIAFTVDGPVTLDNWVAWTLACPQLQGLHLDAPTDVLVQRGNLSDVPHPNLNASNTLGQLLTQEKAIYAPFKKVFTFSLNTGEFTEDAFRYKMGQILGNANAKPPGLQLCLWSFGFKYGLPVEANWVLDVRFIPNPFYVPELRPFTGMDAAIQDYVMGHDAARQFVQHTTGLIESAAPLYPEQGLDKLIVAIGCTGGKHRSVTLVETLARQLRGNFPNLQVLHREQLGWNRPVITAIS